MPGRIDGEPFAWIADADERLGAVLEAISTAATSGCRSSACRRIETDPPDLRDTVWLPARLTLANGATVTASIPTRYPGSEAAGDDALRLARNTEWRQLAMGAVRAGPARAGDRPRRAPPPGHPPRRARRFAGRCAGLERLQPALLDRLEDGLQSARFRLRQARAGLGAAARARRSAGARGLIADERRLMRPVGPLDLAPFARLDERGQDLRRRVVGLEQARVAEMQRGQVLSMSGCATACGATSTWLFNTVHIEHYRSRARTEVALLDGFPQVAASGHQLRPAVADRRVRAHEDHGASRGDRAGGPALRAAHPRLLG